MKGPGKERRGFGFIKPIKGVQTESKIVLPKKTPEGFLNQLLEAREFILSQKPSPQREVELDHIEHAIDAVREAGELADLTQTLLHVLRLPDDNTNPSGQKHDFDGFNLGRRRKAV